MQSPIVVIGSLNADFVIRLRQFPQPGETVTGRDLQVFPGGKGANQAFAAARLGGRVSMIGQVGNDAHGDWLKQNLAAAGVDVSGVSRDPNVTSGVATISIDAAGQNQIVIVPGANGTFGIEQLARCHERIASARFVLLQLEIPMATVEAAARAAKQAGAVVILDPAPAQEIPDAVLACADYLTPNETELAVLTRTSPGISTRTDAAQRAQALLCRGAKKVLVKLGAQGALLVSGELEHFWPAIRVNAVDTTAAGDAFNAGFAWSLASGMNELEAGRFATAVAACSVTRLGAQPSMPTRPEAEALLGLKAESLKRSSPSGTADG